MELGQLSTPWIIRPRPRPDALVRLFCFPYAGGGTSIFHRWPDALPNYIEVCAVRLPGRESRLLEAPFTDIHTLIAHLLDELQQFSERPFAFFGHSMGALIGFELARALHAKERLEPIHVFASGCRAPHHSRKRPLWHTLPDSQLLQQVRSLGGIPKEVLENAEFIDLMLPLIRSDFQLIESYTWEPSEPLTCALTAFGGWQDEEVAPHEIPAWREHTQGAFSVRMFPSDHFFVQSAQAELLEAVSQDLENTCRIKGCVAKT